MNCYVLYKFRLWNALLDARWRWCDLSDWMGGLSVTWGTEWHYGSQIVWNTHWCAHPGLKPPRQVATLRVMHGWKVHSNITDRRIGDRGSVVDWGRAWRLCSFSGIDTGNWTLWFQRLTSVAHGGSRLLQTKNRVDQSVQVFRSMEAAHMKIYV